MNRLYSHIDKQILQDLNIYGSSTFIFKYKYNNNKKEKKIINKYFIEEYVNSEYIFYSMNNNLKIIRKLKLLKVNHHKDFFIIEKIIKNSINSDFVEIFENKLADGIAHEIDKKNLKSLFNLK